MDLRLWAYALGSRGSDQGAHPLEVSGVGPRPLIGVGIHRGALGLCAQATGSLIWVHTDSRLWACEPQAAGLLVRVCAHPGFQLCAPRPLIEVLTHLGFQV